MNKQEEEVFFRHIMSKSNLELPDSDFEDTVMAKIKTQKLYNETYLRNIKKAWACFVAGAVLGIIFLVLLPQFQASLTGISFDTIKLGFQLLFTMFVLFSLDLLIKYTRKLNLYELPGIDSGRPCSVKEN